MRAIAPYVSTLSDDTVRLLRGPVKLGVMRFAVLLIAARLDRKEFTDCRMLLSDPKRTVVVTDCDLRICLLDLFSLASKSAHLLLMHSSADTSSPTIIFVSMKRLERASEWLSYFWMAANI